MLRYLSCDISSFILMPSSHGWLSFSNSTISWVQGKTLNDLNCHHTGRFICVTSRTRFPNKGFGVEKADHNDQWLPLETVTPDPQTAGKCVWQISEMKKHFWILRACLVYLPASEWHFHLSSSLIGSSAHIPIGGSASPHTRSTFTFLTHAPHLPLRVYCFSV